MNKLLILLLLIPMVSFGESKKYYKGEVKPLPLSEKEVKQWKTLCAELSGKAKNEFSAKKIYKNCLDEKGLKD